ncbi:MAG: type 4a pilus biogenesis protein PilO [Pseudomonadota bacterium]
MAEEGILEKIEKIKLPIRILIIVGTVVLSSAVFVYWVHIPKTEAIEKTGKSIVKLNQELTRAKIRSKDLKKLNAQKAQVDIQFQEALRLLPDEKEIPSLLRKITQLGSDANLDFRVFIPQRERKRTLFYEIPVSIEVRGTYHDVAVFFDKVGHMERIMNIMDVSMKPVKDQSTMLVTQCTAMTYRIVGKSDAQPSKKKK